MSTQQQPFIQNILDLGFKARLGPKFPDTGCVIRNFKGKREDVFIKRGRKGDIKVRFWNTILGEIKVQYSFDSLKELKLFLDTY
tara:strand:+ start:424 stop:675 length:252 start_codon:yes stop_codon:yes gene_type:complete